MSMMLIKSLLPRNPKPAPSINDETMIEDCRAAIRPAQRVEEKLVAALHSSPVMMSQMQKVSRPHDR
ncbi:MAG: hypothetical protein U0840_26280 [Gemmataceae bacterium]